MQRTVYSTRYTLAKVTTDKDGQMKVNLVAVEVAETDPKRALKKAFKAYGNTFEPLSIEKTSALWVLDDEIFFKYATKVEGSEKVVTDTPDTDPDTDPDTPTA